VQRVTVRWLHRRRGRDFVAHYVEDGTILNVGAGADADVVSQRGLRAGQTLSWPMTTSPMITAASIGGGGDFGALAA